SLLFRLPPYLTLFPTRRSSDLRVLPAAACEIQAGQNRDFFDYRQVQLSDSVTGTPGATCVPADAADECEVVWNGLETTTVEIARSEEHTSELQSRSDLVCRLLL